MPITVSAMRWLLAALLSLHAKVVKGFANASFAEYGRQECRTLRWQANDRGVRGSTLIHVIYHQNSVLITKTQGWRSTLET
eukprot:3317664-Rhodomonas_salina.1